eukprot:TRINITY_DN62704_c0_g1_i1.p1 TRINITY_DN62704_c0_g1~~TRINITY_DN62704_c0_g1_i1.p1  ORF type:complete len:239 (+),score=40.36 TRINITY_DN62704_c0_g1_i1:73-717(+)
MASMCGRLLAHRGLRPTTAVGRVAGRCWRPTSAGPSDASVTLRALSRAAASSSSSAPARGGGGGVQEAVPRNAPDAWRSDEDKYWEMYQLRGGRQPQKDFKVGPYATKMKKDPETGKLTPTSVFFVSPRKDPVTFVVNCLLAFTTVWTISQLSWGESYFEKRKRVIRERIRQEYGLPKGWEHEIEDDGDLELSEDPYSASAGTPATSPVGSAPR